MVEGEKGRSGRRNKAADNFDAVSDDKFIKLFKETAERKYAFKEAESKRVYDIEAKKLELREKELEIEVWYLNGI
ncbi:hypothetical protein RvY_01846 [Ramazzottius varieornatus]|uniref:Uncharacterized protein n=1 Tax=Ramazzottius varieornatus TaxID=947166 RepID=A0A1D1UL72_RAMVA|nr:hypothetical protein RvY_01846 [Ramazzottius varieornatus]